MVLNAVDNQTLTVSEARNNFSELVNRAAFGKEVTLVHRGRNQRAVVAIVPAELIEAYEALVDQEDGRIAMERLAEIADGRETTEPWDEVKRELGL